MQTLKIVFTRGDYATQPGGLILRYDEDRKQYVTHRFNRTPHTREPREFYWGHYFTERKDRDALAEANADFVKRWKDCEAYEITEAELIAKGDVGFSPSGIWEGNVDA